MKGKDNKHVTAFRATKLKSGEEILAHLEGWVGEVMGKGDKTQHNGQFILTNERACFYRKGFLGEVFETIPLPKITSVETLSRMGYRVLRLHTSNDELAFKTFEPKEVFEQAYEQLEQHRQDTPAAPVQAQQDPMEQLKKLGELRDAGVLTEEEFASKKAALLSRL